MASKAAIERSADSLWAFCVGEKVKTFDVTTLAKLWFSDQMAERGWRRHAMQATQGMLREVTQVLRGENVPAYTYALTSDSKLYVRKPITAVSVAKLAVPHGPRRAEAIRYSPAESGDIYPQVFRDHFDLTSSKQTATRVGLPGDDDPRAAVGQYYIMAAITATPEESDESGPNA